MPKKTRKTIGLPPGSVIFTGQRKVDQVKINYLEFNEQTIRETSPEDISGIYHPISEMIQWYDIRGLHDTELINTIGGTFGIHQLTLEDIADPGQRPKFESYKNGYSVIFKAIKYENSKIHKEQISLYTGNGFVISFQENEDDLFKEMRKRIILKKGHIRTRGSDYLSYALIDYIMDGYYLVLDEMELDIEELEIQILENHDNKTKRRIHRLKQEIMSIRKAISPLREAIFRLSKSDHELITDSSKIYLRDLYDHNVQLLDTIENYRDLLNSLQDLYLSEISLKMNQIMKVLTLITTIFVPLSFLVGLYGMNFDHMPELHWRYGYFILLGFMLTLSVSLIFWFKKKGWF